MVGFFSMVVGLFSMVVVALLWKIIEIWIALIGEFIGNYLVQPIWQHVFYLRDYDSNMKTLETEDGALGAMEKRVRDLVDVAKNDWQYVEYGFCSWETTADSWITTVEGIREEVKEICKGSADTWRLNGWRVNPFSCYRLSRKAKKKTKDLIELRRDINWLTFVDFESRMLIMEEIMAALKDDNTYAIGICGLGGTGKRRMAENVHQRAKMEKLFDKIIKAGVDRKEETEKIQDIQIQIADDLGLTFVENSLRGRAKRLRTELMNCGTVLVILENVWERLDLEAVGIPSRRDHKDCKLMLTSGSKDVFKDVCKEMTTSEIFTIGILPESEAWNFFKKEMGNSIYFSDTAKAIVNECGGFPSVISKFVTILKGNENNRYVWAEELRKLKLRAPENVSEELAEVFDELKLSYDLLGDQKTKSCLLLCCIYQEKADIPVEDLVRYGMGLGLFENVKSLVEARDAVHTSVDKLKRCFLLLDSDKEECVRMHHRVRDVMRSIVADDTKYAFMVEHGLKLKEDGKLELLRLARPDSLFEGASLDLMKQLKVMEFIGDFIPSKPPLASSLTTLQTLFLHGCKLENIATIGKLETLKLLSFRNSSIKKLPPEIGKLRNLMLLDLTGCKSLEKFFPRVIWNLKKLEELYMHDTCVTWALEDGSREMNLEFLSQLITLETHFQYSEFVGGDSLFKKLEDFRISISQRPFSAHQFSWHKNQFRRELILEFDNRIRDLEGGPAGVTMLLKRTESLHLVGGVAKDVLKNFAGLKLLQLKSLGLQSCGELEDLINTMDQVPHCVFPNLESLSINCLQNLTSICLGQLSVKSFGNLRSIEVTRCVNLKNVFSQSIAGSLRQLEVLKIESCNAIEEIVATEGGEHGNVTNKIMFPKLSELRLLKLPRIIAFCNKMDEIEFPQLKTLCLEDLLKFRSFCPNSLASEGSDDPTTQHQHLFNEKVKSVYGLRSIKLRSCNGLLNVFSSSLLQSLRNLKELEVEVCGSLEVAFDFEAMNINERQSAVTLTFLEKLKLTDLPNLRHVWNKAPPRIQGFQNLLSLEVTKCHKLKSIFLPSISKLLVKLETLSIVDCKMLTEIVGEDQEGRGEAEAARNTILFPKLNHLHLKALPLLTSFCPKPYTFNGQSLKKLSLHNPTVETHLFNGQQIIFQSMEVLELQDEDTVRSIMVGQHPPGYLSQLREVRVQGCDTLLNIVPSNLLPMLANLEELTVNDCASLEEVFEVEGRHGKGRHIKLPFHLKQLKLSNLPKLRYLFNEKVAIHCLEALELSNMNLNEIWCKTGDKKIMGFQSLKSLKVERCGGFRELFYSFMAGGLKRLEELIINDCRMMEVVVAMEGENMHKIEIPQLKFLKLLHLPELKSFSQGSYDFHFPLLESLSVQDCCKIKAFSFGHLSTPKLKEVEVARQGLSRSFPLGEGDLNNIIKRYSKMEIGKDLQKPESDEMEMSGMTDLHHDGISVDPKSAVRTKPEGTESNTTQVFNQVLSPDTDKCASTSKLGVSPQAHGESSRLEEQLRAERENRMECQPKMTATEEMLSARMGEMEQQLKRLKRFMAKQKKKKKGLWRALNTHPSLATTRPKLDFTPFDPDDT